MVENELAAHDPLRHIAVQILQFSLSFETAPRRVKEVVKAALGKESDDWQLCEKYAIENGYENIDFLLESIIFRRDAFNALVIIDETSDSLETVVVSRFQFPVELITLSRFCSSGGERVYSFEPFLYDVTEAPSSDNGSSVKRPSIDPSEIDTIVVPARNEGFQNTFLGENRWHAIRIHSSMIPRLKYIAAYRTAPTSAITHVAPIQSISQWQDTNKYVLNFAAPAEELGPIRLVSKAKGKAPQAPRYTSKARLDAAKSLTEVFS